MRALGFIDFLFCFCFAFLLSTIKVLDVLFACSKFFVYLLGIIYSYLLICLFIVYFCLSSFHLFIVHLSFLVHLSVYCLVMYLWVISFYCIFIYAYLSILLLQNTQVKV